MNDWYKLHNGKSFHFQLYVQEHERDGEKKEEIVNERNRIKVLFIFHREILLLTVLTEASIMRIECLFGMYQRALALNDERWMAAEAYSIRAIFSFK